MSRPQFRILLLTVLLFAAVAPMQRPSSAAQPTQQSPSFRVGVDVVSLSVTVTDRMNRYVTDLTCPNSRVRGWRQASHVFNRRQQGYREGLEAQFPPGVLFASSGRRLSATDDETRARKIRTVNGCSRFCLRRSASGRASRTGEPADVQRGHRPRSHHSGRARFAQSNCARSQTRGLPSLEHGLPRPIVEFMARDDGPISVAFLFDTSGSMPVASNLEKGKGLVAHFLTQMKPSSDEAALFTFDKDLRQEVPFTNDVNNVRGALGRVTAWGLTSLYDAIAETAKRVADRGPSGRRAVVVITDGDDTSSVLTPAEVSGLASAIDVPVYVVAVVSPLDHPGNAGAVVAAETNGNLSESRVLDWRTSSMSARRNRPAW